jgi:putative transposase
VIASNHLPVADGRGRYLDNIFPSHRLLANDCRAMIERLWRSLKQEAVYLHELQDGFQAERVIKDWISFYNTERPHTPLDKRSPNDAFFQTQRSQKAA